MASQKLASHLTPLVQRLRTDVCWIKHPGQPPSSIKEALTPGKLARHCNGGPAYGAVPIRPGESVTLVAVFDLDSHGGETDWEGMRLTAVRLCTALEHQGLQPVAFRSTGGRGIHVYLLWDTPQDAYSVRSLAADILASIGLASGTKGVAAGEVEIFPKQDEVLTGDFGSMFILPLAGESVPLDPLLDLMPLSKETAFDWPSSSPVLVRERPVREAVLAEPSTDLAEFAEALRALPNDESVGYDEWRNVVFSIHHATSGSDEGLALAHEWSAKSPKYDPDFLDNRVWPYVRDREGGITDRYVMAKAAVPVAAGEFDGLDEPGSSPAVPRFQFIQAAEFAKRRAPAWLIHNVLPQAGLGVIFGESGSGKTFFVLDLAVSIALGEAWHDNAVEQGTVGYICAEGADGFSKRLTALSTHRGIELSGIPIHVLADAPNFLKAADIKALRPQVEALGDLRVLVVDTWSQVMPGANENAGEDVGLALAHCRMLHKWTGALILLIHHSGKDTTKGARGWSGLRAAADVEIEVVKTEAGNTATLTKMKDGEDGLVFGFGLEQVVLGEDEYGAITSCVLTRKALSGSNGRRRRPVVRGPNQKIMDGVLQDLQDPFDGYADEEKLVEETVLLMALPVPGRQDKRRRDAVRGMKSSVSAGVYVSAGGRVRFADFATNNE